MRNSPIAKTPPTNLPVIPGVTCDAKPKMPSAQKTSPGHKQGESSVTEVDKGLFRLLQFTIGLFSYSFISFL